MLIIAIPKSASSSFIATLRKLQRPNDTYASIGTIPYNDLQAPKEIGLLYKYHKDVREYTGAIITRFITHIGFTKRHIPPTVNNKRLLKDQKKVILLRKPEDVVAAYYRAEQKKYHPVREEFKNAETEEEWLSLSKENGLYKDLCYFYQGWLNTDDSNSLVIFYKDLISNSKEIINAAESHFGLSMTKSPFKLGKCKYTRF